MSTTANAVATTRGTRIRPRHPVALRIGLVLAALVSILNALPAVTDIGLNGTPWDAVVIGLAVLTPAIAIATLVLLPFAWMGNRRPAVWVAALQLVAILGLLPPFVLVFTDGLPLIAPLSAGITILLELLFAWLIVHGAAPRGDGPGL
ncbi:hypothetical protein HII28_15350 [Planctomonas sp. JC2975]|uniref:hypothetical protein n=1 Tax=Planctomonas sp. JC2975 TaxID=2729626 RepID=UPI001475092D|nr:hypothetical protein [Planctomonas sp. JC2975]NNC13251.1 hypothetical protein [Planctomonas sp. JC2975]